jgi:hypothetical protein
MFSKNTTYYVISYKYILYNIIIINLSKHLYHTIDPWKVFNEPTKSRKKKHSNASHYW